MRKKFENLRDGFLEDLNSHTDSLTEKIKSNIGIKHNKKVKEPSWFSKNKKPVIWTLSAVMTCLLVVITVFSVITYKNTPVYKEMIASNFQNVRKLSRKELAGDVENEIIDKIGIIHLPGVECYAAPSEEILITVKIDNPKSFEILSFTLNNYKYQSFEFVEGSNSSEIIVKFKVGSVSGIEEITIDAIKYVDGESIRDVRFEGEKTIKIGVTYQNVPNVSDISEIMNLTDYGINVEVKDEDDIIDPNTGINIYLFDTENLLSVEKLNIGRTLIPYSNLRLGSEYTYIIVGVFDLLDGEGKKANILYRKTFITDEGYNFGDITTDYDSAHINLMRTLKFNGNLTKVELYNGDSLVDTVKPNELEAKADTFVPVFNNLLSNTTYECVATYEYSIVENGVDTLVSKEIRTTVKTEERPTPTVSVKDAEPTKDGLVFDYDIMDTTTVGKIVKLEVYKLNDQVEVLVDTHKFDEDIRKLTNLLSNNTYKFYATYKYDLLDGTGEKFLTVEYTFTTLPKEAPVVSYKDIVLGKRDVSFNYDFNDIDSVGTVLNIQIIKNDEVVETIEDLSNKIIDKSFEFKGLLSNNDYVLRVNYQYDLNDGDDIHVEYFDETIHTIPLEKGYVIVTTAVAFGTSIFASFQTTDSDLTIKSVKVELYKGDTLVVTSAQIDNIKPVKDEKGNEITGVTKGDLVFKNIESGNYTIVVVYEYDLNDGTGIHLVDKNYIPDIDEETNKCGVTVE